MGRRPARPGSQLAGPAVLTDDDSAWAQVRGLVDPSLAASGPATAGPLRQLAGAWASSRRCRTERLLARGLGGDRAARTGRHRAVQGDAAHSSSSTASLSGPVPWSPCCPRALPGRPSRRTSCAWMSLCVVTHGSGRSPAGAGCPPLGRLGAGADGRRWSATAPGTQQRRRPTPGSPSSASMSGWRSSPRPARPPVPAYGHLTGRGLPGPLLSCSRRASSWSRRRGLPGSECFPRPGHAG
jgi:hypothetical protein